MAEKLPIAFLAGLLSVVTPCVLPLVPGYLAAISSVDVSALGARGSARRVVRASIPFIAGFTAVFVLLGAGAAAIASVVPKATQTQIAGFVLVVIGLAFIGLLPSRSAPSRPVCCAAPARRGRGRCSEVPSQSAPHHASAQCSRRSSSSRAPPGRSRAG
jgi:Cytochrome c biogenesis protein